MNKRKTQVKSTLEYLLHRNAGCQLAERQPLLDFSPIGQLVIYTVNAHPAQRKLQEHARTMVERLEDYQRYYTKLLHAERQKYEQHFQHMFKILKDQYEVGLFNIDKNINHLEDTFERKRMCIVNAQKDLVRKESLKKMRIQEKIQNMGREMVFEVQLVEVQLSDLTTFRQDIRKYTMSAVENTFGDCLRPEASAGEGRQGHSKVATAQEMGTQTDRIETEDEARGDSDMVEEMDELLGCDEDIGQKLSASSRRRMKYAVGRRDVIKEEDESSESSILSES